MIARLGIVFYWCGLAVASLSEIAAFSMLVATCSRPSMRRRAATPPTTRRRWSLMSCGQPRWARLPTSWRRAVHETLTYYAFPDIHWRKIRTNNPLERIMKEIRRRTRVVGTFPDGQSCLNLAAARLRHLAGTTWSAKCLHEHAATLSTAVIAKPKPLHDECAKDSGHYPAAPALSLTRTVTFFCDQSSQARAYGGGVFVWGYFGRRIAPGIIAE